MKRMFNPLAFSIEENNRLLAEGWEPLPVNMWFLTERRKQEIEQEKVK